MHSNSLLEALRSFGFLPKGLKNIAVCYINSVELRFVANLAHLNAIRFQQHVSSSSKELKNQMKVIVNVLWSVWCFYFFSLFFTSCRIRWIQIVMLPSFICFFRNSFFTQENPKFVSQFLKKRSWLKMVFFCHFQSYSFKFSL